VWIGNDLMHSCVKLKKQLKVMLSGSELTFWLGVVFKNQLKVRLCGLEMTLQLC
jgi:hypothetical protein